MKPNTAGRKTSLVSVSPSQKIIRGLVAALLICLILISCYISAMYLASQGEWITVQLHFISGTRKRYVRLLLHNIPSSLYHNINFLVLYACTLQSSRKMKSSSMVHTVRKVQEPHPLKVGV